MTVQYKISEAEPESMEAQTEMDTDQTSSIEKILILLAWIHSFQYIEYFHPQRQSYIHITNDPQNCKNIDFQHKMSYAVSQSPAAQEARAQKQAEEKQ